VRAVLSPTLSPSLTILGFPHAGSSWLFLPQQGVPRGCEAVAEATMKEQRNGGRRIGSGMDAEGGETGEARLVSAPYLEGGESVLN